MSKLIFSTIILFITVIEPIYSKESEAIDELITIYEQLDENRSKTLRLRHEYENYLYTEAKQKEQDVERLSELESKHLELLNKIKEQNKEFASALKLIELKNIAVSNKTNESLSKKINDNIEDSSVIKEKLNNNFIFIIILFFLFIFVIIFLLLHMQKLFGKSKKIILKEFAETYQVSDEKLINIIENQLELISDKGAQSVPVESKPDHELALKVADEIVRIQSNLSRMDKNIKGLKQLNSSVKRIKDNFEVNGYEMIDMLNQNYNEGLKAVVNFKPDDNLQSGEQIITRVIKPQVNYKGVMIQSAQIEVSQGE